MREIARARVTKPNMLLVFLSASCGLFWGLVGFSLARDIDMRPGAWVGLVVSPLIGLCVGRVADRARPKGWIKQIFFSLLSFYGAVSLFLVVVLGASAVWRHQLLYLFTSIAGIPAALFYFTVSGYGLILWPFAVFNHCLLWWIIQEDDEEKNAASHRRV